MAKSELKMGSILSYVQMALSTIISLVYAPVMMRLLGQNEYGLYQTVVTTISMLSVLNLGFGTGYVRYFSLYKSKNDNSSIHRLNGLFMTVFLLLGTIVLLCGLYISFNLKMVFAEGLTSSEYALAKILMIIQTSNLALSFPMSIFASIISANERFVFLKTVGALKTVLAPMASLLFLLLGYRSIALASVTVSVSLFADIAYIYYSFRKLKVKFIFKNFEKGLFKSLFSYTSFIAINLIVDQFNGSIPKLILSRFKGTAETAIYSVSLTIYNFYMMFSTAVSGVFTPKVHNLVNNFRENTAILKKELTALFIKVGRVQYLILSLVIMGLVFFGKPFITVFWAGENYVDAYYIVLILSIPATVPLTQNIGIEIQRALNLHKFRSVVYAFMAVFNFVFSIFLCKAFGAVGCAFGTGLSYMLANGLILNIYYHKKCNIDIIAYWKNIGKISCGLIIPAIFGVIINLALDLSVFWQFALGILLYSIVHISVLWKFSMNDFEKNLVIKPLKNFRYRLRGM